MSQLVLGPIHEMDMGLLFPKYTVGAEVRDIHDHMYGSNVVVPLHSCLDELNKRGVVVDLQGCSS